MSINLSDFEKGADFGGDYADALAELQHRLARIQIAYRLQNKVALIVVEGWDASGKGGAIKRACAGLDPRGLHVYPIAAPTPEEKAHHFLWRFWNRLPGKGEIAIFDRSWYGRLLVERVEGFAAEPEWRRGYDEINEFESQITSDGAAIVKIFFHITHDEQDKRLQARLAEPWKRWKVTAEDFRNRARRDDYCDALKDMFAHTDTRWAPWHAIDGNDKKAARIAALTLIAETLEKSVSMKPPALPDEIEKLARKAFG